MSTSTFKAVILAGGSGERFWPLSTPERPKQFLRVFGGASLIRQAVSRLGGFVSPKDVFVVTAKNLVAATRKELPEVPKCNIIGEPMRRDTGAAVALGVGLAAGGADPVVGFFSSDQMVANPKAFRKVVSKAVALARRKPVIVTLGIKPTYPATCFGYISPKTRTFVEKPDAKTAKKYVKAGYLWNAGMFIARASTFRGAFAAVRTHLEDRCPKGMKLEFEEVNQGTPAFRLPLASPVFRLAASVLEEIDPRGAVYQWDGASIPVVSTLKTCSGAAPLLVGFGQPEDRIHSPNESYGLNQFARAMAWAEKILAALVG